MQFGPVLACVSFLSLAVSALCAASPAGAPAHNLSYSLEPRQPLRYRMVANLKGKLPVGDSTESAELSAKLSLTYTAIPKTRLSSGVSDVDLNVSDVDLEILDLPFSVPEDQARDILDLTITMSKRGEVLRVHAKEKEMPFSVSVPGVDPKRLYALIFPVVFQKSPVREGDTWSYKSELLGGQGTSPRFTAMLMPQKANGSSSLRLKQQFEMAVDVKKDADKKTVTRAEDVHRSQTGKIEGDGVYLFDRARGRVTRGDVKIRARIKDVLVGAPKSEDEPKQLDTDIEAKVTIDLVTSEPKAATSTTSKKGKP